MIHQLFIDKELLSVMMHNIDDYNYIEFNRQGFNFNKSCEIIQSTFNEHFDFEDIKKRSGLLSTTFSNIKSDIIYFIHSKKECERIAELERLLLNEQLEKQRKAKHAHILQTPLFVKNNIKERQKINQIEVLCKRYNEHKKIKHNVDHVIPLRHNLVSGLHCASNMHVITEHENVSHRNSFDEYTVLNMFDVSLNVLTDDLDALDKILEAELKIENNKRKDCGLNTLNMLESIEFKSNWLRCH